MCGRRLRRPRPGSGPRAPGGRRRLGRWEHNRISCGGADCDDTDPRRYSEGAEICAGEGATLDEDCDPTTLAGDGEADNDNDGFIDARCSNPRPDGSINSGRDCDDTRADLNPDATESCNTRDDDCDGDVDEAGAFCPVGMCMSSRCRSVPWERTFPAADDAPAFGMTIDADGAVYLGLIVDTPADLDGDGSTETFGTYLLALEADGRFRFVHRLPARGVALVAVPGEPQLAVATASGITLHSTTDGSEVATLSPTVEGATIQSVAGLAAIEAGLVVAVSSREGSSPDRLDVLLFDGTTEVARRRLEDADGRYELDGLNAKGQHIVVQGNTGTPLELAGTSTAAMLSCCRPPSCRRWPCPYSQPPRRSPGTARSPSRGRSTAPSRRRGPRPPGPPKGRTTRLSRCSRPTGPTATHECTRVPTS
ncbi:MAG: putative metal-binding motif-containing protein [Sandaracinaceae bacterium]